MNKRLLATIILSLSASGLACRDLGRGGTGELVVPPQRLREIETSEPADFAVAPPTTAPTTLPSTRASTQPVRDVPLTIEEVRQLTLRNNLDLRVELFNPSIARESLNAEEARFESLFVGSVDYGRFDRPSANAITEQLEGNQSESLGVTPGLRIPLRTGGQIDLSVPISRQETDASSALLNPAYSSDVAARLSLPLLRGAGADVNAQSIRVAFYGYQQAQARTKLEVIRLLTNADRVYWRLYGARQALIVRTQEYDLAVQQLQRARNQVAAGAAAEVEVMRAQAGVADRVEAIITAENLVRDRERELKRTVNAPDMEMGSRTAIVPATDPRPLYYQVDAGRMIERSMQGRMELLDLELQIARETADVRLARNDMLPLVSLDYTYNINGLGGSLDESFALVDDNRFVDHRVGLQLQVPIGNEAARSRLRQALLSRLQTLATREQRELQIRQEVLNAIDQLEANWQRILAARQRVVAQARVVQVEIRQFEQGLRTSTEVLDAQTQLAAAKLSEISAVTEYEVAQVDIAQATGTVLGQSRVAWEPAPAPRR